VRYFHWLGRDAEQYKRWEYRQHIHGPFEFGDMRRGPRPIAEYPPVDNKTRENCIAAYDNVRNFCDAFPIQAG
jgi:hypothetical protein